MATAAGIRAFALLFASALAAAALAACGNASNQEPRGTHPVATIVDLSTSVGDLARDFDSHAGEPRFVMLLSPT